MCKTGVLLYVSCLLTPGSTADDATEPGNGILTNLHVTDLNIERPVPNQTCMFGQLRELDLDGGAMTGTIPFFLTQCFPYVNEIDLSYNQVRQHHIGLISFMRPAS